VKAELEKKTHQMLRQFAADPLDKESVIFLSANPEITTAFLFAKMDLLTKAERLNIYTLIEAMLPEYFEKIVNVRLGLEDDPECRHLLSVLADMLGQKPRKNLE
jgi:hypothetical protein